MLSEKSNMPSAIVPIEKLDFRLVPWTWPFSGERREDIAAHFAQQKRERPSLWNGQIFMLRQYELSGAALRGEFFATGFADLLAWRDWGYPDSSVKSCFAMAAIETADGGFLVGVMNAHTANAGKVYFPTGTADADDLNGDRVDMDVSVRRELGEETGLSFGEFDVGPHWNAVFAGDHIALIKHLKSRETADVLGARVRAFLATDEEPEFADIQFFYKPDDLTPAVPPYVCTYLTETWRQRDA